jgi:hypothetical protein
LSVHELDELLREVAVEKVSDQAFLLRCWQDNGQWRFSLETIGPQRQRRGFRSLEDLVAYLRSQLSSHDETPASPPLPV